MPKMKKKQICIVTGSRAEYGLLYWLMKEIQADPEMKLQLVVTGMHLSPEFGLTWKALEQDGFDIDDKVEMLLSSDSPVGIVKSIGLGVIGFADSFARLQPDIVVVLGDRFEILAAAQAAAVMGIRIGHISGGEITEGAIDDAIRHAVTKLSNYHFVAAEEYRRRVIQMGEPPQYVINCGDPGLDNFHRLDLLDRQQLEESLDFSLQGIIFLVTYHPVTISHQSPESSVAELLKALDAFPEARVIMTKPNADAGGRIIAAAMEKYANANAHRVFLTPSLGQLRYLSAMRCCDLLLGNSSSGIVEAPAVGKAVVNVGDRQKGRLKASCIIDCDESADSIIKAIQQALSSDFQAKLADVKSLYGDCNATLQIKQFLQKVDCAGKPVKKFYDM